jgi:hypothetical protein
VSAPSSGSARATRTPQAPLVHSNNASTSLSTNAPPSQDPNGVQTRWSPRLTVARSRPTAAPVGGVGGVPGDALRK